MPSPCCTNCHTKYSVFNPEEGCSNCALSFCRRCLPHRAILPHLANKPVTVCSHCFEKLNAHTLKRQSANGTQITRITIGDVPDAAHSSHSVSVTPGNWWGDGLPPPSMRQSVDARRNLRLPPSRTVLENICHHAKNNEVDTKEEDLEERFRKSRQDGETCQPLTLSQIEERLAALRGCDVELIRRPRCMFETKKNQFPGESARNLMEMTKERVHIEDRHDPAIELERRHAALRKDGGKGFLNQQEESQPSDYQHTCDQSNPRLSTVSSSTVYTEATAEELDEINRLLEDAQMRVNSSKIDDDLVKKEMKSVVAATRQKSLEIEKLSDEIGRFWDRQFDKVRSSTDDSEEESVDDESIKKIILEAERTVEDKEDDKTEHGSGVALKEQVFSVSEPTSSLSSHSLSPRKSTIFSKLFHR